MLCTKPSPNFVASHHIHIYSALRDYHFGQGSTGQLLTVPLGISQGCSKAGSWKHPKVCSLLCVEVIAGCWMGRQKQLGLWPEHLHDASPYGRHGGWVPRWMHPKIRMNLKSCYCFLWPCLGSQAATLLPRVSERVVTSSFLEKKKRFHLWMREWQDSGRNEKDCCGCVWKIKFATTAHIFTLF